MQLIANVFFSSKAFGNKYTVAGEEKSRIDVFGI